MGTQAWVIRAGAYGERERWALAESVAGGGWPEVPDLTGCLTREDLHGVVVAAFPGAAPGLIDDHVGQLWALRHRVLPGDLLVMPLKTTRKFALGRITGGYRYLTDNPDPGKRHVVEVGWRRTDLPRAAIEQDLLFSLGSTLNIFIPNRHNAAGRLEDLLAQGRDPGPVAGAVQPVAPERNGRGRTRAMVDQPDPATDLAQFAHDQIEARIAEDFPDRGLVALVSAVLAADGFLGHEQTPGPGEAVHLIAGRGPLGLDRPRVLVRVGSGEPVGPAGLAQLRGAMDTHRVDQGLLVAWGGLTGAARESLRTDRSSVRVWESKDVVAAVVRTYDRWSDDMRARLALRRIWTLGVSPR
jgi:restriction system protein